MCKLGLNIFNNFEAIYFIFKISNFDSFRVQIKWKVLFYTRRISNLRLKFFKEQLRKIKLKALA